MLSHIPLEAFRVFDAACRHMNFSRAGRELNITQAAVSRRIKGLEDHLGAALFQRRGKNLALTPKGERLFQRVRATLDYLEESLEAFRPQTGGTIAIAASGSVSHLWLGRRLQDFGNENPQTSLRLLTSDTPSDLASENNDLVILYSAGEHPRWDLTLLLPEVLSPVAAPAYLASRGIDAAAVTIEEIARLDLIDYERFNAHWISFRQWFDRLSAKQRVKPPAPRYSFSTYVMAIDAAVRGDGIALGSLGLIDQQLRDGRLVQVGGEQLSTGYGYYLGLPRHKTVAPEVMRLYTALIGQT
ncbi:DNA-binding transcriptional LysR family regulator [Pararhizobium capsulatum DSM 1112]|uniref:DNA-binding transcriptional LysR family regulator n=1 Tax=Pararhizobium capsulatum DSM 1112 TaxID=1121113 RepID=A0ABU0BHY1_9HYPH|nr:LysR substrate-binding domain-containing protein [Pararhizobium capsulatum]MDQ0317876.1 DNA-binding transcriptional LysR family regulator [Pararhizobium capsulatum DSM 1112]